MPGREALAAPEFSRALESFHKGVRYTFNVLLTLALGYLCARLTWLFLAGVTLPVSDQALGETDRDVTVFRAPTSYNILSTFDPFFRNTMYAGVTTSVAAPETNLDLKLFGIRVGAESGGGSAIILTPDKQQSSYAVGQEIMADVFLNSVSADRVTITRNGIRESLSLNPERDGDDRLVQSKKAVASLGSQAMGTLPSSGLLSNLLSQLTLRPRLQGGGVNGFYVEAASDDRALLTSLGLMPADVILSVNDVRLVSPERITDVIEELEGADSVGAVIERDGASITLTLERPVE